MEQASTFTVTFPYSGANEPLGIKVAMRVLLENGKHSKMAVVSSNPSGYACVKGDVLIAVNGDTIPENCPDPVRLLSSLVRKRRDAKEELRLDFRRGLLLQSPPPRRSTNLVDENRTPNAEKGRSPKAAIDTHNKMAAPNDVGATVQAKELPASVATRETPEDDLLMAQLKEHNDLLLENIEKLQHSAREQEEVQLADRTSLLRMFEDATRAAEAEKTALLRSFEEQKAAVEAERQQLQQQFDDKFRALEAARHSIVESFKTQEDEANAGKEFLLANFAEQSLFSADDHAAVMASLDSGGSDAGTMVTDFVDRQRAIENDKVKVLASIEDDSRLAATEKAILLAALYKREEDAREERAALMRDFEAYCDTVEVSKIELVQSYEEQSSITRLNLERALVELEVRASSPTATLTVTSAQKAPSPGAAVKKDAVATVSSFRRATTAIMAAFLVGVAVGISMQWPLPHTSALSPHVATLPLALRVDWSGEPPPSFGSCRTPWPAPVSNRWTKRPLRLALPSA
jgi:hypothetical protein